MAHLLAMADRGEHRQHRFHHHPGVPSTTRTDFHVGGVAALGRKARIRQDQHLVLKLGNQGVKRRVVDVGSRAAPGTYAAPLVQDETELPADNPPRIVLALLADWGWAAPFPHRVNQLDARSVRHP
jgi:hypothetical protein